MFLLVINDQLCRCEFTFLKFSAAHCIRNKNQAKERHPDELSLIIGRHNLAALTERGSTIRDVHSIVIHPDWKSSTEKWDADIAILTFVDPVKFTTNIQPICISSNDETFNSGTVV